MRLPLLIAALAFAVPGFGAGLATPPGLAELQRQVATAPAAQQASLLTELARRLEGVDPLRGIATARAAAAAATSPRETLAAEAVLAPLLRDAMQYADAKALAASGLERATALGDASLQARFCYELGRADWSLGQHADALKLYHEAIGRAERLGDTRLLIDVHLATFIIWEEFEEHSLSLAHLEAARKLAEPLGDPDRLVTYYRCLGNYRRAANDLPGARAAHERSRDISARAGLAVGYADALHNLAFLSELEGHLDAAYPEALEAAKVYEQLGLKRYLANVDCTLGRILIKEKRFPEAIAVLLRSLNLLKDFGSQAGLITCYRQLASAYQGAGDAAQASYYQKQLAGADDSTFGEQSHEKVALLKAQFEIERDQNQLELLRRDAALKDADLQQARIERYGFIVLGLLGALAAAAIVSRQRLKLRAERRVLEETRRAQAAAEDANRLKTRLLGIASHDLKSPLAGLIGCAREIEQAPDDAALMAELGRMMRGEGERMLSLVHDLLDMSAIEGGRLKLTLNPCDLSALARSRVEAHRAAADAKHQTLTGQYASDDSLVVEIDTARVIQVLDNLVSNAVKFTPRGKPIEVSVEATADHARVRVRDSGPGLQPADFGRIFQPFQTLSAQPTGGEHSSGLGLFIAKQIVALHGGTLDVASTPGAGATFTVTLPRAKLAEGFEPTALAAAPEPEAAG